MDMLIGISLILLCFIFAIFVSPILLMAGIMGAGDDPNVGYGLKTLGIIVCLVGIIIPIILFVSGIFLLI